MDKKNLLFIKDERIQDEELEQILSEKFNLIKEENFLQNIENLIAIIFVISFESEKNKAAHWIETGKRYGLHTVLALQDSNILPTILTLDAIDLIMKPYIPILIQKRMENIQIHTLFRQYVEYDNLTGLYNRDTFYQKTKNLISLHENVSYTIMCIDIERFKVINDLYGTQEGDKLLQYLGTYLQQLVIQLHGTAGHIVSDIFAICIPYNENQKNIITNDIIKQLKEYPLNMEIVPAIGFYYIDEPSIPISRMCDRAILALNTVKNNYLSYFAEYDQTLRNSLIAEQDILNDMEYALETKEFKVYLQPKCDMRTGKIVGAEALVRWEHKKKGMIRPNNFIPIFEQNGFILKLDTYIWEEVCILLHTWKVEKKQMIPISVNVSRMNLYNSNLCNLLVGLVKKYEIEPWLLELEITESAYTNNLNQLLNVINDLRDKGFVVLMDDFGSGYSSLNMLKDIDVDILKIDMKFLKDNDDTKQRGGNILEAVVRMAKWLNLRIIAEGVETKEQVDFLLSIGCSYAQGYYFYKPISILEFESYLCEENKIDVNGIEEINGDYNKFIEFLHADFSTNIIWNKVSDGMAFYELFQDTLELLKVNQAYLQMMNCTREELDANDRNILNYVAKQDRERLIHALKESICYPDEGKNVKIRRLDSSNKIKLISFRCFYIAESDGRQIFFAILKDKN